MPPKEGFAFHPMDPRSARQRLLVAVALGAVAWIALPVGPAIALRALAAWDVAAVVLLTLAGWIIVAADVDESRRRAGAEDPGRFTVWLVVLVASLGSVLGAVTVARQAPSDADSLLVLVLPIATVGLSWLVTHVAFTLHYAHLYYRGGPSDEGGLEFPGGEPPDDFDFAYFAFTIGMCFQVSDVTITDRPLRRTALLHSLLSFTYNTVIVALVLNLVMGHL